MPKHVLFLTYIAKVRIKTEKASNRYLLSYTPYNKTKMFFMGFSKEKSKFAEET